MGLPHNTVLDGIQAEEDSILMKPQTTMLKHLSLMLVLEISDKATNFMLGTQEIEDITIMKVNLIMLKLQHQTLLPLFQTLELEILDLITHLTIGIQVIESIMISNQSLIMPKSNHNTEQTHKLTTV